MAAAVDVVIVFKNDGGSTDTAGVNAAAVDVVVVVEEDG